MAIKIEDVAELAAWIAPKFERCCDKDGNELVFLQFPGETHHLQSIPDKTQCEALKNHIHLFHAVKKCDQAEAKAMAIALARNLIDWLEIRLPDKKFVVTLEINWCDSTVPRFHQCWEAEPPYIDPMGDHPDTEVLFFYSFSER